MTGIRELAVLTVYGALLFMVINNYRGFVAILNAGFTNWNNTLRTLQGPA